METRDSARPQGALLDCCCCTRNAHFCSLTLSTLVSSPTMALWCEWSAFHIFLFLRLSWQRHPRYLWLYIIVLKSFLVYISDIFTAITMLTTSSWRNEIFNSCADLGCVSIPYNVGKWLFVGCIIFSFLLVSFTSLQTHWSAQSPSSLDMNPEKQRKSLPAEIFPMLSPTSWPTTTTPSVCPFKNRLSSHIDTSYRVLRPLLFLRSHQQFHENQRRLCLFRLLHFQEYVIFHFENGALWSGAGWKRLLLADGPRQTINALTLYAIFVAHKNDPGDWWDVQRYFKGNSLSTSALTVTTCFTVAVFVGSLLLLIVAGICYVPLLMHIRGNLKVSGHLYWWASHFLIIFQEYCCHKVDKVTRSYDYKCVYLIDSLLSASAPSSNASRSNVSPTSLN